jgi:hypothetical protein
MAGRVRGKIKRRVKEDLAPFDTFAATAAGGTITSLSSVISERVKAVEKEEKEMDQKREALGMPEHRLARLFEQLLIALPFDLYNRDGSGGRLQRLILVCDAAGSALTLSCFLRTPITCRVDSIGGCLHSEQLQTVAGTPICTCHRDYI